MTKHLLIKGHVQGVGYRMSLVQAAQKGRLTGWVRNCSDGNVEAMVQGPEKEVRALIAWVHKGPALARVDEVVESDGSGNFSDFQVRDSV